MATRKKTTTARAAAKRKPAPKTKISRRVKEPETGGMTVREAGRKGGLIGGRKGGLTVKAERGVEFYQEIGRLGGQRVRDLIAAGRKATERSVRRRHT
jgi:general stress protein YciG